MIDPQRPLRLDTLLGSLERDGLLLLSDAALPSVVSLVVGGPIRGSWWGHPRGADIYRLYNELADQPQVLLVKLISGKVTFVHRRLAAAVIAVGQSREGWQMQGLSEGCLMLLSVEDDVGQLAWDDVPPLLPPDAQPPGQAVRALDARLLIHTAEVHTPSGAHARNLQTWSSWARSVGVEPPFPEVALARQQLEAALRDLNDRYAARARLPWQAPRQPTLKSTCKGGL